MAEHPRLLDTTHILSSEISLLSAPILSADGTQQASDIQARMELLTRTPPTSLMVKQMKLLYQSSVVMKFWFQVLEKMGNTKVSMCSGEETGVTVSDLKPATDYHAKVQAEYNSIKGTPSEAETFTTLSCEPDIPNPPRIANRTKNSLTLQWKMDTDLLTHGEEAPGDGRSSEAGQCVPSQELGTVRRPRASSPVSHRKAPPGGEAPPP